VPILIVGKISKVVVTFLFYFFIFYF